MSLRPIPRSHALRDAALLAATGMLWAADAGLREGGGPAAAAVAVGAGVLTAVSGYLAHEWGHFVGARLSGSAVQLPAGPAELFLFRFDADHNGRRQFLAMSLGGFAASALVVTLLLAALPWSALSAQVAFGLTALGVIATALLELPAFWRVLRGGPIPRGGAYVSAGSGPA